MMKTKRLLPVLIVASLLSSLDAKAETCVDLMDQMRRLTENHLPREQTVDALRMRIEALAELEKKLFDNGCIKAKKRPPAAK